MASGLTADIMFPIPVIEAFLLLGQLAVSLDPEKLEAARAQLVKAQNNRARVPLFR